MFKKCNQFDLKKILKETTLQMVKDHELEFSVSSFNILNNGNYLVFFNTRGHGQFSIMF